MPMGMHTVVSEGGGGISGGQRQRLLIARAIVRKPRILLFDEATSALDNRTQAIVSQSLKALNATRVVIAHRLSTVMRADRICVLDKGALVEMGSYHELMAQGGAVYAIGETAAQLKCRANFSRRLKSGSLSAPRDSRSISGFWSADFAFQGGAAQGIARRTTHGS